MEYSLLTTKERENGKKENVSNAKREREKRKGKNKRKNKKRKKERVVLFVSFPFHSLPFSSPFALRPLFFF